MIIQRCEPPLSLHLPGGSGWKEQILAASVTNYIMERVLKKNLVGINGDANGS